jgi:hypothetical protein
VKDAREKSTESYLRDEIKKRRGICIKMDPNRTVGIPDRLCILPSAMFFVELKTPKGKLRAVQDALIKRLTAMSHTVHILRTKDEIDSLLRSFPVHAPKPPPQ